ncbi:hypothetical protein VP1G_07758 [Cytospora mali]|uniref:Uncharacterized protein n=1 Tax=Cytospora mali TaxID=578113 RepID=A0A194V9N4_CYTMA|nr:hypothetical protein VP1G_07758 [Valsa mali var. pyri (nom. inval.)]
MAALGLASLGNLHNDKQLQHLSKVKYGDALKSTNEALRDPLKNLDAAIRAVIMLALYQLVPSIQTGVGLPDSFFQWVRDSGSSDFLPPDEKPGADLAYIIARFAQLNATIRNTVYSDGRESTTYIISQLLGVDGDMEQWETSQKGKWRYKVHRHPALPAEAVFRKQYHRYSDVWTSRVWNHFRWARLLVNQLILEFVERYPTSSTGAVPPAQPDQIQDTIRRLAVDVLTSSPTHYKHPRLTREHLDIVQTHGGAGAGAVGIPHLMFQLQVAACAPGVSYEIWQWALDTMETAWGELGMMHVRSLTQVLRSHRANLDLLEAEGILKVEVDEDVQGVLV